MAIYGVGAFYDGNRDVSAEFIARNVACVGWSAEQAPALQRLFNHVKTGDIVYIKAHPPGRSLTVKAVGIVLDEAINPSGPFGQEIAVRWLWTGPEVVWSEAEVERYNVRSNTLYEELSPAFQQRILQLLFSVLR